MSKNAILWLWPILLGATLIARAAPLEVISEDDATQYDSGWSAGKNGGNGFGKWNLQTSTNGGNNSQAGFYIASAKDKSDLNGIAADGKAFGVYANGEGFECAAAFRAFNQPLRPGQSFSWEMEHGAFVKKFAVDDSAPGASVGITLLPDANGTGTGDYNKSSRFEFSYRQVEGAYVIADGEGSKKLDIPFTDAGLAVTFTLVTPDTYNLEFTVLAAKYTYHVDGRKLGGKPGEPIRAFCFFDRNGELSDFYFNGFQVLQKSE